ncbi:hypothetical protein NLD30_11470, partial [SCandidatus Aminicenantes bacterium Aminicenantia_JdfR_composite]|nr:hypothetical protein [SCandidatus Aminicenantes bacterium Aminicenantia_JdfR_composite]
MEKSFQFYKIGKILAVILLIVTLCIIGLYFIFKTDKNHISISPQVEKINKPKFQESIVHF